MRGAHTSDDAGRLLLPWARTVTRVAAHGLLVSGLVGAAMLLASGELAQAGRVSLCLPLALAVYVLLHRGAVRYASIAAVLGGGLVVANLAWATGGMRSVAFGGMTVVIALAATTLERRWAFGTAAGVVLMGVVFALVAPTRTDPSDERLVWVAHTLIVSLLAAIVASFAGWLQGVARAAQVAQAGLADREARLRRALDAAQVGIWDWDMSSGEVGWEGVESLLGLEEGSFEGTYEAYVAMLEPSEREVLETAIATAMDPQGTDEYAVEQRVLTPAGEVRILEGHGRVTRGPDGEPTGLRGTVADVTTHRQMQLRAEAHERLELVGELAGSVAHDVNNLLSAIRGHAEFALDEDPPPVARRELEGIVRATRRGGDFTRDLLALAGRHPTSPQVLDLREHLDEERRFLERMLGDRHQLRFEQTHPAPLWSELDPALLAHVVFHLVANARDAMPDGGTITIRTVDDGQRVGFEIVDDGVGMDEAVQARIFEPFFTTKGLAAGTGLGLSSARRIVQDAGGTFEVKSEKGRGSTFGVLFPAVASPVATTLDARQRTVLVADDEALVRRVMVRVLRGAGYEVLEAKSGEEALEVARQRPIDLLVTDSIMPGMEGSALVREVRHIHDAVPALMVTGYAHDPADHEVLLKPFARDELLDAVTRLLGESADEGR